MKVNSIQKVVFLGVLSLIMYSSAFGQVSKHFDFNFYMSRPSVPEIEDAVDYVSLFNSPLIHLRLGRDVYAKNDTRITPHLGIMIVNEQYTKPSKFEGYINNVPGDTIYIRRSNFVSFASLGAEYKKYFNGKANGIYLSVEPQFSFLMTARESLTIRHNNKPFLDESKDAKSRNQRFNAVLIVGAGYELRLFKRLGIALAIHLEFRPLHGYFKNDDYLWVSPGLLAGFRF